MQHITFILLVGFLFSGCTGKELKRYGGELALNNGGGNPIMVGTAMAVGGTLYGVGTLLDNEEEREVKKDNYYNEPRELNYKLKDTNENK